MNSNDDVNVGNAIETTNQEPRDLSDQEEQRKRHQSLFLEQASIKEDFLPTSIKEYDSIYSLLKVIAIDDDDIDNNKEEEEEDAIEVDTEISMDDWFTFETRGPPSNNSTSALVMYRTKHVQNSTDEKIKAVNMLIRQVTNSKDKRMNNLLVTDGLRLLLRAANAEDKLCENIIELISYLAMFGVDSSIRAQMLHKGMFFYFEIMRRQFPDCAVLESVVGLLLTLTSEWDEDSDKARSFGKYFKTLVNVIKMHGSRSDVKSTLFLVCSNIARCEVIREENMNEEFIRCALNAMLAELESHPNAWNEHFCAANIHSFLEELVKYDSKRKLILKVGCALLMGRAHYQGWRSVTAEACLKRLVKVCLNKKKEWRRKDESQESEEKVLYDLIFRLTGDAKEIAVECFFNLLTLVSTKELEAYDNAVVLNENVCSFLVKEIQNPNSAKHSDVLNVLSNLCMQWGGVYSNALATNFLDQKLLIKNMFFFSRVLEQHHSNPLSIEPQINALRCLIRIVGFPRRATRQELLDREALEAVTFFFIQCVESDGGGSREKQARWLCVQFFTALANKKRDVDELLHFTSPNLIASYLERLSLENVSGTAESHHHPEEEDDILSLVEKLKLYEWVDVFDKAFDMARSSCEQQWRIRMEAIAHHRPALLKPLYRAYARALGFFYRVLLEESRFVHRIGRFALQCHTLFNEAGLRLVAFDAGPSLFVLCTRILRKVADIENKQREKFFLFMQSLPVFRGDLPLEVKELVFEFLFSDYAEKFFSM